MLEEAPTFNDDDFATPDDAPSTTPTSVLDALRAQHARAAAAQTFDVVVPGWGDLLVLRLGSITSAQQQRLIERARSQSRTVDADFLAAAFQSIHGRATSTGDLVEIVDDDGDSIGLDRRLADLLGLGPVKSARQVLDLLFSRANSPALAISAAASEWSEWARGANDDVDEGFLGES